MRIVLSITIYAILGLYAAKGQSLESVIAGTDRLFDSSQRTLSFPVENDKLELGNFALADSTYLDQQMAYNELLAQDLEQDLGLAFNARALYNLQGDFEDDVNNYTKSRLRTELEWNIVESGLMENRIAAKKLQNTNQLLALQQQEQERIAWRRQFRVDYTYSINEELIQLLTAKEEFLDSYFDLLNELYRQKYILREQLLQAGQKLSRVSKEIELLKKINQRLSDSLSTNWNMNRLPIVQIDTLSMEQHQDQPLDSLLTAGAKLTHHWAKDLSVSLFTNYNWVQTEKNNRDFASIGFRLSVPIRTNKREELIRTRVRMEQAYYRDQTRGTKNQYITYLDSYREKISDLRNQYRNWLVLEERKRQEQVRKDEYGSLDSGLKLLEIQDVQFDILENTLKLKKQLYTSISHLYQLQGSISLSPFSFQTEPAPLVSYGTVDNAYSQKRLLEFALANNIEQIHVPEALSSSLAAWEASGITITIIDPTATYRPLEEWMDTVTQQIIQQP